MSKEKVTKKKQEPKKLDPKKMYVCVGTGNSPHIKKDKEVKIIGATATILLKKGAIKIK
ncbi:MAG: hypothetical protein Unbinned2903contig1001_19 [Prokaryotic dsDNA virus sp.]|nr:MAG: hypothetical protein Unbinned2903contig1001_19 [Prokaryotic dsDNA virus sp.]|tara:strand:+ start:10149 stop:10325 length:177 start_codon:yes stop_codon:yes gene_type:complete